jgi:drug/metabolite transporter (DMT)-like permease
MAVSVLFIKSLSRTEHPSAIVLYMNLILTPLSLFPALFVWRWPSWPMLAVLACLGLFATLAHQLLTRAYTKGDASAVIPFDYARLPFIAVMAYVVFGEVPSPWTWPGAAIIAGAAVYIVRREAKRARRRAAGASPQGQV